MSVADILKEKGFRVVHIAPDDTVAQAARKLHAERIGALVVRESEDGPIIGLISERDIIRGIAMHGETVLERRVDDLMTSKVVTCKPTDIMSEVMKVMTVERIRHLPVLEEGEVKGIISIGDVVKRRIETMLRRMRASKVSEHDEVHGQI